MKLHLIGICGTGMGSLAGLLKAAGHEVRGSDENVYPPMSDAARRAGDPGLRGLPAPRTSTGRPSWWSSATSAARTTSRCVAAAGARSRADLVPGRARRSASSRERHSLVVAGTHGKTTTAALAALVLHDAGRDPSFLIGGVPLDFGRELAARRRARRFVVEGDEYDTAFFDKGSKFLHYRPRTAILTSVEFDHVDIFRDLDPVKAAFRKFVALIPADGLLVGGARAHPDALDVARARALPGRDLRRRPERDADYTRRGACRRARRRAAGLRGAAPGRGAVPVRDRPRSAGTTSRTCSASSPRCSGLGLERPRSRARCGASPACKPPPGGARRRRRGHRHRRLRPPPDRGARDARRALRAALRPGPHHRGVRAALGDQPRAVFQDEYAEAFADADEVRAGAAARAREGPRGRALRPRAARPRPARARHAGALLPTVDEIVEHLAGLAPGDVVVVDVVGRLRRPARQAARAASATRWSRPATPTCRRSASCSTASSLPHEGVGEHLRDFLVIRDPERTALVGCVGIELHDDAGLLRSLAVMPERRGQGLGWMLADYAIQRAARPRAPGGSTCSPSRPATSSRSELGFVPFDRGVVEPAVQASLRVLAFSLLRRRRPACAWC